VKRPGPRGCARRHGALAEATPVAWTGSTCRRRLSRPRHADRQRRAPFLSSPPAVPSDAPADGPGLDLLDLGLPAPLPEAARDLGFRRPTPTQAAAIPPLRAGRDLTGGAQTRTGKTAAFGLPLLAAVDTSVRGVQAIVLTPTRELAMQVAEAIESFARRLPG